MPPEKHVFHNSLSFMQYYPCSILKGRLYLGDANHATNWYVLKNMRITHIANITNCVQNEFDDDEHNISYCQIEVEDTANEDLTDYFPQFYWFLEDAFNSNLRLDYEVPDTVEGLKLHTFNFKEKKAKTAYCKEIDEEFDKIANETLKKVTMNKVLVHCQMGRSRSATMVIMYILYKQLVDVQLPGYRPNGDKIFKYVQSLRNVIDPNRGFLDQIDKCENLIESGEMQRRI